MVSAAGFEPAYTVRSRALRWVSARNAHRTEAFPFAFADQPGDLLAKRARLTPHGLLVYLAGVEPAPY